MYSKPNKKAWLPTLNFFSSFIYFNIIKIASLYILSTSIFFHNIKFLSGVKQNQSAWVFWNFKNFGFDPKEDWNIRTHPVNRKSLLVEGRHGCPISGSSYNFWHEHFFWNKKKSDSKQALSLQSTSLLSSWLISGVVKIESRKRVKERSIEITHPKIEKKIS